MRKQHGLSLLGVLLIGILVAFALLLSFKLVPAYTEYFSAQKTLAALVSEQRNSSPEEIRRAFERRSIIDDISSFKSDELDIEQGKEGLGISVAYDRVVPLFSNVYLLLKFEVAAGTAAAKDAEQK